MIKRRIFEQRLFADRSDAGRQLSARVAAYASPNLLVLGLARGGVPVAAQIAGRLHADLDAIVARKIGAPGSPELAIGAVTARGGRYLNEALIGEMDVPADYVEATAASEVAEARRQADRLRGVRSAPRLEGRVVMLVDDGLATGATMRAAARSVRTERPSLLVVVVPVGSQQACAELRDDADEVVCLYRPEPFRAVGLYYDHFEPVDDAVVRQFIDRYGRARAA